MRKCLAGFQISDGPCTTCGATDDDKCRRATPRDLAADALRVHFSILEDGPDRFVLVDQRTDEDAPVYPTIGAAEAALDQRLYDEVR